MRSLSKPPKTKKIQKQQAQKKPQSKKITKTVFSSPFTYKIQTLSHQDMDQLRKEFLPYLKQLRTQMPIKPQSASHSKFISFKPTQNALTTLTSPQFILGVKSCIRAVKQKKKPQLVIVFYEENRQEMLQELLCRLLKEKVTTILTRNDDLIKDQLSVKILTCIGLRNQQISHKLSKLATRCSVEIPWLVEKTWIGLKDD